MRLIAWTRLPDEALTLIDSATALPGAAEIPGNVLWYLVQSTLAIWDTADADLSTRLTDHMTKALREADEITSWTHPNETAEARVLNLTRALVDAWWKTAPPALSRLIARGAALSLCQLALKFVLPGIPDIYRGCEGEHLALTDPDNRRAVDPGALAALPGAPGLAGEKRRLTVQLLALRGVHPDLFARGAFHAEATDTGLTLRRSHGPHVLTLHLDPDAEAADAVTILPVDEAAVP